MWPLRIRIFEILILALNQQVSNSLKPNIIIILADDLGWNDVGFHGNNEIATPNIDALAYSGIILNNYYVTPICTPSRSALLTGKYPIHTGLQHGVIHGSTPYGLDLHEIILPTFLKTKNYITRAVGKWHLGMQHKVIYGGEPWGLGLQETILPQYLKKAKYVTAAVGKWHLGHYRREYLPKARGFDSHYGYWTGHQDYYDHTAKEKVNYWGYDMRRGMNTTWSDYGQYTTDLLTDEAVKLIQHHNTSKPLFLYVAHLATHSANSYSPLQAPFQKVLKFNFIKNKNRRLFAGMLSKLDDSVGSIIAALNAKDLLKNSIIIFSTDNGGPAGGFDLNAASNWPLRGVKDTLWEGGVRGVGFIWSPLLPSSRVSNALVHIVDWLPTLLFLTNMSMPKNLDGVNVWHSLFDEMMITRKEILLNIDPKRNISALRYSKWKYMKGNSNNWNGWYGPSGRNHNYNWTELYNCQVAKAISNITPLPKESVIKMIREATEVKCLQKSSVDTSDVYLFDLERDPCEQENLASNNSAILNTMEKRLKNYIRTMIPPRNKPIDPRSNPKYWGYAWVNWVDFL